MSVFIIAEVGPNHNGDLQLALKMTERLAKVGVDAVKFQLSIPDNLHSLDSFKARYQKEGLDLGDPLAMSRKLNLSFDEHLALARHCDDLGVEYLCTAFDIESLRFVNEQVGVKRFKIPSGEIFSLDIIEYVARQLKPIILSTGMATYDEIGTSLQLLDPEHRLDITVLHCISNYPAPLEDVHLRCMLELGRRFQRGIGFSDHTIGNDAAIAAVALGAQVIEKHVTLDKSLPGPDHKASATVGEFASLVRSVRNVEKCFGLAEKKFSEAEREISLVARKSIVVVRDMEKGEILCQDDICYRRPGTGLLPTEREAVLGRPLARAVAANRVLKREDIVWL